MTRSVLLLIDDDIRRREQLAFAVSSQSEFLVQTAYSHDDARAFFHDPDLTAVVCNEGRTGEEAINMLRLLRDAPATASLPFVLMTAPSSSGVRVNAWAADVDAVLSHPVPPAEVLACVHASLRRRAHHAEAMAESARLEASIDQMQELLLTTVDAVFPDARRRGEELASLGSRVARELDVPFEMVGDLRRAARLHEIGRFFAAPVGRLNPGADAGRVTPAALAASAMMLRRLPAFELVAELISAMGANWDGSGTLSHLERGEIPLRSRILRVTVDFLALTGQGHGDLVSSLEACDKLMLHYGTHYDPAVLSALRLVVSRADPADTDFDTQPVRIDRLTEGLTLAHDLCTASGVKLLSAGAVLTSATLKLIAERNAIDPIVHAVTTRPRGRAK